ncbi:MAG TPA: hypothetical protein VMD98_04545 [Bryocella sp.]|nr:hypothetical protein [Bryocella sp.]
MRALLCALLFACPLLGQTVTRDPARGQFFVDGIVYEYAAATDCIVVAAVHSVLNHKFLAVKIRVYNASQHSFSVRPEDIVVEDAVGGRQLVATSAAELARRMRKPYNMARYAVNGIGGGPMDTTITSDMVAPLLSMMKEMAERTNSNAATVNSLLYTDLPGTLDDNGANAAPAECDQVCRLRNGEGQGKDALTQLQRQTSAESVEQYALLANTIPPRANVGGVLYFPLGKLSEAREEGRKTREVRVTVPVLGDNFRFELPVE